MEIPALSSIALLEILPSMKWTGCGKAEGVQVFPLPSISGPELTAVNKVLTM